ncbi:hypothetical protein BC831DRAFT_446922 [Entophlyctis helioformis]|nr:hypothetical protein BC831DRAFT_446922 [Entophlyctis helioformis]
MSAVFSIVPVILSIKADTVTTCSSRSSSNSHVNTQHPFHHDSRVSVSRQPPDTKINSRTAQSPTSPAPPFILRYPPYLSPHPSTISLRPDHAQALSTYCRLVPFL